MMKIVFLFVVILFISGCVVEIQENKTVEKEVIEPAKLTKDLCEKAGGHWDDCGWACRGMPPETFCAAVCVEYCECLENEQCPEGYECTEYVDDLGICSLV